MYDLTLCHIFFLQSMHKDVWRLSEMSQIDLMRVLRQMELEAYTGVINAFSAQGDLTERKRKLLKELQTSLCISPERHKAEIRRALNDDTIESVSKVNGEYRNQWIVEGKRSVPLKRRPLPETIFTKTANAKSKLALERPDLLRPAYKFFYSKSRDKDDPQLNDNIADPTKEAVENGGEVSAVDDDNESQSSHEAKSTGKSEADGQTSTNDAASLKPLVTETAVSSEPDVPPVSYSTVVAPKEQLVVAASSSSVTKTEVVPEDKLPSISSWPTVVSQEPKPIISSVQSLFGKPVVMKSQEHIIPSTGEHSIYGQLSKET